MLNRSHCIQLLITIHTLDNISRQWAHISLTYLFLLTGISCCLLINLYLYPVPGSDMFEYLFILSMERLIKFFSLVTFIFDQLSSIQNNTYLLIHKL